MNKLATVLTIAAATLITACGTSVHVTKLNHSPAQMQPRPVETVEVYTAGPPARPRVDVAFLEAEQSSSFSLDKTPEIITELRHKAAKMGCDALVIGGTGSRDPGLRDKESWLVDNPKGRKSIHGTCVMYVRTAPPQAAR